MWFERVGDLDAQNAVFDETQKLQKDVLIDVFKPTRLLFDFEKM